MYFVYSFYYFFRNVSQHWKKHGTQNISSVPNVDNNLVMKASTNVMVKHIVAMIILICLHQSALAAIVPLWKITFQH